MSDIERFWRKTRVDGDCIVWTGAINVKSGYGYFTAREDGRRFVGAHRFIYTRVLGPLPSSIDVMHSCDRRSCVKLQHLSAGTRKRNMEDAVAKGRTAKGQRNGQAVLTDEQAEEIRRRCAAGEVQRHVAREFGVSEQLVSHIVNRKRR